MTEHYQKPDYDGLKLEIELIKKDIFFINTLIERMDVFMVKIQNQHDVILEKTNIIIDSKVKLTVDDISELCLDLDKTKDLLSNRISMLEKTITEDVTEVKENLSKHIAKNNSIVNTYNKIIYAAGVILAVIIWGINNLEFIRHIIK
jgi:hypothetical protein